MVEEQRGQIGTLKALGYSNIDIIKKYTVYSGTAAIIGCVSGYALCIFLFPYIIWVAYQMMYIDIPLIYIFDWKLATISLIVSLACSVGTTLISCRYELGETAASLMRPKAPKPGKRVFLERVPFIWNRMKFLHKVSIRNILRYKRRFFMMVVGISGCTALLLTAFGIKDSVAGFAEAQYGNIQTADAELTFKNADGDIAPQEIIDTLNTDSEEYMLIHAAVWDLLYGDNVKSVNLIAPGLSSETDKSIYTESSGKYTDDFNHFFKLNDLDGNPLSLPSSGEVLVSISISRRYKIHVGDNITLRDEDMNEIHAVVTGIFKNHVYNYVIVSPDDLHNDINGAYINYPSGSDIHKMQSHLSDCEDTVYVTVFEDFKERMSKMMSSLDYVVLIIILSAAGLAFVVLYNLTNINITERIREIATIKVLGFYQNETAQYVFRENVILASIGMLVGLGLGILLHKFVMSKIIVDMVYFNETIKPMSYVYSMLLTLLFTFLVNLVMRRKLDTINMAESLKSVE
jgi:ABC-type antimicrobial peptide transport system, permease component